MVGKFKKHRYTNEMPCRWKSKSNIKQASKHAHKFHILWHKHMCASLAVNSDGRYLCECESTNKSRFRFSVCYANGAKGFIFMWISCQCACLLEYRLHWFDSAAQYSNMYRIVCRHIHDISIADGLIFVIVSKWAIHIARFAGEHKSFCIWYFIRWPMNCTPFLICSLQHFATLYLLTTWVHIRHSTRLQLHEIHTYICTPCIFIQSVKFRYLLFCLAEVATEYPIL